MGKTVLLMCLEHLFGDCRWYGFLYINEPELFWSWWTLFKFNGSGVPYEVTVCACTGDILWIIGLFPCGQWPELKIFWHALMCELVVGKIVEADFGYQGYILHINEVNIFLSESGQWTEILCMYLSLGT